MTVTAAAPDVSGPDSPTATTATSTPVSVTVRTLARRLRGFVLIGVLVLVSAITVALLQSPETTPTEYGRADPADTSYSGAKALALVLARHGVTVTRVDTAAAALARADSTTQVVITLTSPLTADDARRLAASPADLLILGPVRHLDLLARGVRVTNGAVPVTTREPRCGLPAAVRSGSARTGGASYAGPPGSVGCYPTANGPTLIRLTQGERAVTVLGDVDVMTNGQLAQDGNAALALNLAGTKPHLVWLVEPDRTSSPGTAGPSAEPTITDLIPSAVNWAVFQLLVAVAVLALWRGRRLGPVVTERLPVVVRASETTEGRARLYQRHRARDRAALALRSAAIDRMTPRLGLPRGATPEEIITTLAGRTGHDPTRVRTALYGPDPTDDAYLVALADYLDELERQVRDS